MTVKRRARLWAAAILAIAGASANSGYSGTSGYAEAASYADPIDPATLQAVLPDAAAEAQSSFERFLAGATMRTSTGPDAAVRIRQGDASVWLFSISRTDAGYAGHPAGLTDSITFESGDVMDWSYTTHDGRMHGNFGARAMMDVLPPHRAALIASTLSLDPMPKGW